MIKAIKTAFVVLVVTAAACSDAVAPRTGSPGPVSAGHGVTTALSATDTTRFNLTIDAWRGTTYSLGAGNSIQFPAGSVCDPAKSTYGPTEWDKPCTAARNSVTVTAKAWLDGQGHPRVDFTPDLRFVPSQLPTGWVTVTFADSAASRDPGYTILYCKRALSRCVDESTTDATLATARNPLMGQVTRRIKHVSGYLVASADFVSRTRESQPILETGRSAIRR